MKRKRTTVLFCFFFFPWSWGQEESASVEAISRKEAATFCRPSLAWENLHP
jgi:hypothetical protein